MSGAAEPASRASKWADSLLAAILLRAALKRQEGDRRVDEPFSAPPLPIGGPTTAAWREETLARASELKALAEWIAESRDDQEQSATEFFDQIRRRLDAVGRTATGEDSRSKPRLTRWVSAWRGASFNRTLSHLDAVEADLLRLAPRSYLEGELPSVQAHVSRFLPKGDPRRDRVDQIATGTEVTDPEVERGALVSAYHAANTQRRRDLLRVRDFRNVLYLVAITLILPLVVCLALLGYINREAVPLCFFPVEKQKVVCPTEETHVRSSDYPSRVVAAEDDASKVDLDRPIERAVNRGDIFLVEVLGLIAAAVASAVALRRIRGSSTPFPLAVALALVKVPLGALTAVLGLLFMSGQFVPGLSALDSSAQILGWALVFGYAQQLFTRFVDQRAAVLLEKVGGRGAAGDKELPT